MNIEITAHSRTIGGVEYCDFPIAIDVDTSCNESNDFYPASEGTVLEDVPKYVRLFGRDFRVPFMMQFREGQDIELLESERDKAAGDAYDWHAGEQEDAAYERWRDREQL